MNSSGYKTPTQSKVRLYRKYRSPETGEDVYLFCMVGPFIACYEYRKEKISLGMDANTLLITVGNPNIIQQYIDFVPVQEYLQHFDTVIEELGITIMEAMDQWTQGV